MIKIILASQSEQRKALLKQIGLDYVVEVPNVDEKRLNNENPQEYTKRLSFLKASSINENKSGLVIAADTVIIYKNKIFGKPFSNKSAIETLTELSGKKHSVLTGMTLIKYPEKIISTTVTKTKVFFRKLDIKQIINYVNREVILECAGAYRIQGLGSILIKKIKGSYSNIVGLPIETLYEECNKLGISFLK